MMHKVVTRIARSVPSRKLLTLEHVQCCSLVSCHGDYREPSLPHRTKPPFPSLGHIHTRTFIRFPRLGGQGSQEPGEEKKGPSLVQRFKDSYKQYGKVLVGVHAATSVVWFGGFYYCASNGLDIIPWLEHWNMSETIIKPFRSSGLGHVAVAYLLYKLATPARYTVTILGTRSTARYLIQAGYLQPVPEANKISSLVKEGRSQVKEKYGDIKGDVKDKYGEMKGDLKEKYGDIKGDMKGKYGEVKGDLKDKYGEVKGDLKDKYGDVKYDIKDKYGNLKESINVKKKDVKGKLKKGS